MKDIAQIRKVPYGGSTYMLTVINSATGFYYTCSTIYFATIEAAKEYAEKNELIIKID